MLFGFETTRERTRQSSTFRYFGKKISQIAQLSIGAADDKRFAGLVGLQNKYVYNIFEKRPPT
jgi:hypothetical protein